MIAQLTTSGMPIVVGLIVAMAVAAPFLAVGPRR